MNNIRTRRLKADAAGIHEAAAIIRAGGLVAIPTETVYGLAADATNAGAVARIYEAKGRPVFNPLIAHFADGLQARKQGLFNAQALGLASRFWPGPLTLVVPASSSTTICELARAGLSSVAVRVPSHPVAQQLLHEAGVPLAAPSANRSGHVSPTCAEHVLADLDGKIEAVLDAGPCVFGIESTIVACLNETAFLLRAGSITRQSVAALLGRNLTVTGEAMAPGSEKLIAPGLLSSHYAPRAQLRLNADYPLRDEAWLTFGGHAAATSNISRNLSPTGNLTEAAANLYGLLRELDLMNVEKIAVFAVPEIGLGEAINDRLRRAASPKV